MVMIRGPVGYPLVFPVNYNRTVRVNRHGTRYRGSRPQGPLIQVPGVNLPSHMNRRFRRRRTPFQRAEPVMNTHFETGTHVSGNSFNNELPHANLFHDLPRALQHPSTLAINHLVSLNRNTLRYVTKRGQLVNPYGILFEDLERDFDEVAGELTVILTKPHIEPDELDRSRYLLQLMSEFDQERTDRVKENIERILSEKRARQMANQIRARPRTLRNRARSLGRRITRGIQRRLGTRASRNTNLNNE